MNDDFLRSLEIFIAVADNKNMTSAAKKLGITQSAVSQQLNQLEEDLGCLLVDRQIRPITLTVAGMTLVSRAEDLLQQAGSLKTLFDKDVWTSIAKLRIAVIGSLAGTLVPHLISSLSHHTNIENFSVSCGLATTRENALLSRDADMLITSDPLYDVQGLERFPIFREPFILVLPDQDGPWDSQKSLDQLFDIGSFIRYSPGTQMGWAIDVHLNRMRLRIPNSVEFDNPLDILQMVSANEGWTITTPSHVLQGLDSGQSVRSVPFPGPAFNRTISLIVRSEELGNVANQVHAICTDVVKKKFFPEIKRILPGIGDDFCILSQNANTRSS